MTSPAHDFRSFLSMYVSDVYADSAFADPAQTKTARVVHVALPGMTADDPPIPSLGPIICAAPDDLLPNLDGYEDVVDRLRRLAAHPAISRLAYVRQLSTTPLAAAVSAAHTRLEHVLGAFDVAVRLLAKPLEYMLKRPALYQVSGSRTVKAILTLAFLHDAFHPPFGHVLDPFSPIFFRDRKTPRLDDIARTAEFERAQRFLNAKLNQAKTAVRVPTVVELLRFVFDDDSEIKDVVDACVELLKAAEQPELEDKWKRIAFAFDILWSTVDHDRLDYIARDFVHVNVFLGTPYYLSAILQGLRCEEVAGEVRLVFGVSATVLLQNLLETRKQLYAWIYEAKEKARYDVMLQHAAAMLLEEAGYLYKLPPEEFARDFLRLTDFDFVRIATTMTQRPRRSLAASLTKDAMNNRPFVLCHYEDIPNSQLWILSERYKVFGDRPVKALNQVVYDYADALGFEPTPEDIGDLESALSEVERILADEPWIAQDDVSPLFVGGERRLDGGKGEIKLTKQDSENLFWTLVHGSGDFRIILEFERLVWVELKRRFPSLANKARDHIATRLVDRTHATTPVTERGKATAEMVQTLDREWPPVYIYMSLTGRGAQQVNNDKVIQRQILAPEGRDGKIAELRLPDREGDSHCWLAAYRPASIGPVGCDFDNAVDAVVSDLIERGKWIVAAARAELHRVEAENQLAS